MPLRGKRPNGWPEWAKRNKIMGTCIICRGKLVTKLHCEKHRAMQNKINMAYQNRRILRDLGIETAKKA